MEELLLSIIVPVYNVEHYLRECLESIVGHLSSNQYEIILINDGSTDGSTEICNEYINKYNNIVYISQKNSGLSAARNSGINAAKGSYLFFLDSDDYVYKEGIEKVLKIVEKDTPDLFFIRSKSFQDGTYKFTDNQNGYSKCKEQNPLKIFSKLDSKSDFWFAAWLVVIKREFAINNNLYFYEGIYHEDELWVPMVFSRAGKVVLIDDCIYCYRENRKDSIVNRANIKKEFDKGIVISQLCKEAHLHSGKERKILLNRCAALEWGILLNAERYSDNERYKELCKNAYNNRYMLKSGKYWIPYILLSVGKSICTHINKKELKEVVFVKQMSLFIK